MSLQRALDRIGCDRELEAAVRHIVAIFRRHPGEWLEVRRIALSAGLADETANQVLTVLAESFVLDSSDAAASFRYSGDTLANLEIDRFLRRADTNAGALQGNVERFRQRYSR